MKIRDIARLSGVSVSTVSRVTNGYTNVPKETYDKVMKVINEYGYVPNESARMLTGKKNKTLGLFIVELKEKPTDDIILLSPWFTSILAAIVNYTSNFEYNILVTLVTKKSSLKKMKELFVNKTICGGIFVGAEEVVPEIEELDKLGYKLALLEQNTENDVKPNSIFVNSDNVQGAFEATKYLIQNGHRKIVHLAGNLKKLPTSERIDGYKKALNHFEVPFNEELIIMGEFQQAMAYERISNLLKSNVEFSGIFAANDDMALGAIEAIKDFGKKVPDDISVIGYDDTMVAKLFNFSSVKAHVEDLAELLVGNLIKIVENPDKRPPSFKINCELVVRDSVKNLN